MMRYIKLNVILLCFGLHTAHGQTVEVLDLPTILQRIDEKNLSLKAYGERAAAYTYQADAATAWMAPMVGLGTWATPLPLQKVMDPRDRGMIMLRAEQQVPSAGKLKAQKRFIESQAHVERARRSIALNSLKAEAKQHYYNWLIALQQLHVIQRNARVLATMKKIEEVRYPYNQSALSSIYRSEAAVEENMAMAPMQQAEIERAKGNLNALMNRDGDTNFTIDTTYTPQYIPAVVNDTMALAASRRDILQMDENIRSIQLNIDAVQQQRRPDFRLQFDYMLPLHAMMPKAYSVMAMMSIPFAPWSAKMYKSDVKAMQANIQAMQTDRSAMLQQTQGMVYAMQGEIVLMQKRIRALETGVIPALQKTFDANYAVYQENKLSLPVLLESWEALNMMQTDVLNEKKKFYQMIIAYEKELYR